MVLQGQQYIQNKTVKLPKDLDVEIREALTTMFGDSEVAAQRVSAVKSAYAYLSFQDTGVSESDSVDPDLVERAILNTTKGAIEYGDRVFEAPNISTNEKTFSRTIKSISATHWDREGGFVDFPSKKVKEALDNGDLSFIRMGAGKYAIVNSNGEPLVSKLTNDVYVFDFNKEIYTVNEETAEKNNEAYLKKLVDPNYLDERRKTRLRRSIRTGW